MYSTILLAYHSPCGVKTVAPPLSGVGIPIFIGPSGMLPLSDPPFPPSSVPLPIAE